MGEHKTSKNEKSSKKLNIAQHKKTVIGGVLVVAVAISGILAGIILSNQSQKNEIIFTVGLGGGLFFVDSLELYFPDSETSFIIDQIAEGLLDFKVNNNGTATIPSLAEDWEWNDNATELTCFLRHDVKFHDGTLFDATAVKWNFDRIQRLLSMSYYPYIWLHSDGEQILNDTIIINDYTVKFILNRPYVPFEAVLSCAQAYILSPTATPANGFIPLEAGLVGTGPFIYESSPRIYDPIFPDEFTNIRTTMNANEKYWGGKPFADKFICEVFDNATLKREAMLSGEIHFSELWPYEPEDYTLYPGFNIGTYNSRDFFYISMNNSLINTTMREAISYSLDYDRLLEIAKTTAWAPGGAVKTKSPLSFGLYFSNWSAFKVPLLNVTRARKALLDANWPGTSGLTANDNVSLGNEWELIANSSTPLASYNFSYIIGNPWREELAITFNESLRQIGIKVEPLGVTWIDYYPENPISQFYVLGWGPDIIDPSNNINPLFSNKLDGFANTNFVNDTLLQQWMEEAIIEPNKTARGQLYYDIQERLTEVIYPHIWWFTPVSSFVIPEYVSGLDLLTATYKLNIKEVFFNQAV